MQNARMVLAGLLVGACLAPSREAGAQDSAFASLEFLVGSCWKGTFPDGRATDEHCYEWVYNRKFIRGRHLVLGQSATPYRGETWYAWDRARRQIVYQYYNSHGDLIRGTVVNAGEQLVFPESISTAEGVRVLRTLWRRTASDRYEIRAEEQSGELWRSLWSMVLVRQPSWNDQAAPRPRRGDR